MVKQALEALGLLCASAHFQTPGAVHMVEADVLLRGGRGGDGDPIMAHPPETDSDITLQEWLEEMAGTDKGIKLDFKRYFETKHLHGLYVVSN